MKAEIRFEGNGCVILITDVIAGITKTFGPFPWSEADRLIRDSDKLRLMFQEKIWETI